MRAGTRDPARTRSSALEDFPYPVAELRETRQGALWRLASWEDSIGDAEFTRDNRFAGRTARIVPVQFAVVAR